MHPVSEEGGGIHTGAAVGVRNINMEGDVDIRTRRWMSRPVRSPTLAGMQGWRSGLATRRGAQTDAFARLKAIQDVFSDAIRTDDASREEKDASKGGGGRVCG